MTTANKFQSVVSRSAANIGKRLKPPVRVCFGDWCDYCILGLLCIRHANARGMFCNCLNDKGRYEKALM